MQQLLKQNMLPLQRNSVSSAESVIDSSSLSATLQRHASLAKATAQRAESSQPNNTGMPENLKAGIESLSGFSMDDVRVHYNSSKPATVQALAYTQGTDIHVAPGQEKCLPHEAWHVAQQMAGRVSPTTNINGMPVNDNAALEHEADVMGEKAVQMFGCTLQKNNGICNNIIQQKNLHGTFASVTNKLVYVNGSTIQCDNVPAYFETKNDDGCKNSRYFIGKKTYERVAPINALRSPNQEYHNDERNFVYYKVGQDLDMGDLLYQVFKGCIPLNNGENLRIDGDVKDCLVNKLLTVTEDGKCKSFDYGAFLKKIFDECSTKSNMQEIEIKMKYEMINLITNSSFNSYISKKPLGGLAPFDWFGIHFHPGHPIVDGVGLESPELTEDERAFYQKRHTFASTYAKKYWTERKIENRTISPEKQMDEFFSKCWDDAICMAENEGEELYAENYGLFYKDPEIAKKESRCLGRKKFTTKHFLLLAESRELIKNYLDELKSVYLDSYENFKSHYNPLGAGH